MAVGLWPGCPEQCRNQKSCWEVWLYRYERGAVRRSLRRSGQPLTTLRSSTMLRQLRAAPTLDACRTITNSNLEVYPLLDRVCGATFRSRSCKRRSQGIWPNRGLGPTALRSLKRCRYHLGLSTWAVISFHLLSRWAPADLHQKRLGRQLEHLVFLRFRPRLPEGFWQVHGALAYAASDSPLLRTKATQRGSCFEWAHRCSDAGHRC